MKKFRLLLCGLMVAGMAFTSCSDDDGDSSGEQASITGKWFYAKSGVGAMGQEVLQDYSGHAAGCTKDNIELLAEDVFKDNDYSGSACDLDTFTGTWTRSGNNVTIDGETYQIAEVTENILKLVQTETQSGQTVNYIDVYTRN